MKIVLYSIVCVLLLVGCEEKSNGGTPTDYGYDVPQPQVHMPYVATQYMAVDSNIAINLTTTDQSGATISYSDIRCIKDCANIAVSLNVNIISITSSGGFIGYSQISFIGDNGSVSATNTFTVFVGDIKDSDGDLISDIIEDNFEMDKTDADQDGDGVIDGNSSTTSSISDQFFYNQWHIQAISRDVNRFHPPSMRPIANNDLGLMDLYDKYMGYNGGNPIVVQVVDSGVDIEHEDLKPNINLALSRDSSLKRNGKLSDSNGHGTMCAGIVGARAFNGVGVRGVAPFVNIAASNWLSYATMSEISEVWTQNDPYGRISISTNSWGQDSADDELIFEELMEFGAKNLRLVNGKPKGKIFLMAAGNSRTTNHDCGLQYMTSNKYGITVAALTHENIHTSYSSTCSNMFVSGYAGEMAYDKPAIATTYISGQSKIDTNYWITNYTNNKKCFTNDGMYCSNSMLTWGDDTRQNYTYMMNGTSAATPSVAGTLALVVEACPNLTLRDIKHLMVKHSTKVDNTNPSWVTNSAGYRHSVDYGFGLINATAMIAECKAGIDNIGKASSDTESFDNFDLVISPNTENKDFSIVSTKTIEWVGITIHSDHTDASSLELYLTSPSGIETKLMLGNNSADTDFIYKHGFRIGSVAFYGETANGDWNLKVVNKWNTAGTIDKIKFEVYGH